jgi:hypothetical protein
LPARDFHRRKDVTDQLVRALVANLKAVRGTVLHALQVGRLTSQR